MRILHIISKYIVVILLGLLAFWIDSAENIATHTTIVFIITFSFLKAAYNTYSLFQNIVEVSIKNIPYHHFLSFMGLNVALIIISFSIDFFCLSEVSPHSFSGVNTALTFSERYADFLYFSILAFTNFGYDQISPMTFPAKFMMSMELIVSFTTVIFILSDFISLKESISQNRKK